MQLLTLLLALIGQQQLTLCRTSTPKASKVSQYGVVDTDCQHQCQCPPHQTWNEVMKKCVDKANPSPSHVDKDNCNVNEYFSYEEQRCIPSKENEKRMRFPTKSEASVSRIKLAILVFSFSSIFL